MLSSILQISNALCQILMASATIVLAVVAIKALRQIKVMQGQNEILAQQFRLAKEDIDQRNKRESILLQMQQIEFFRKEILDKSDEFTELQNKTKKQLENLNLTLFTPGEIAESSKHKRDAHEHNVSVYKSEKEYRAIARGILNAMESFALLFTSGSDDELAKATVGEAYCGIIDAELASMLVIERQAEDGRADLHSYAAVISLHTKWKAAEKGDA